MTLKYLALDTSEVRKIQSGYPDANGQIPEQSISDGNENPCRHCLKEIPLNKKMLICAYRPFPTAQPYSEVGPIFICGDPCSQYSETSILPDLYRDRTMLIRGYSADDRIVYGTGQVLSTMSIAVEALKLFEDPVIYYIHVRSSTNNCYHFRIENGL